MEHTQPSLIANIPHLQRELTAGIGPSTYSNIAISGGTNHIGHYYAPQAPQPSPPAKEPPFTVPFSRDENFVPRDGVVEELIGKIRPDQHSRAALFGMGGVGFYRLLSLPLSVC